MSRKYSHKITTTIKLVQEFILNKQFKFLCILILSLLSDRMGASFRKPVHNAASRIYSVSSNKTSSTRENTHYWI